MLQNIYRQLEVLMFKDRIDAGKQLGNTLLEFKNHPDTVVVALPRGGVPVGFQIAKRLNLPLDIVCPRKIGAPYNPEYAIGAITETGEGLLDEDVIRQLAVSDEYLNQTIKEEAAVARRRLDTYRKGLGARSFMGKVVIIVDDGIATGATIKAAIASIKKEGAKKIIVAVPVSPPETLREIEALADEAICLSTPPFFQAVGQFYENFSQTSDEEVIELLNLANLQK
jgi:putative phosphoribosyl transferase